MNYNDLRRVVASCVEGRQNDPHFRMNMYKLRKRCSELGLIPLYYKQNNNSRKVMPDDITLLMEFFKEEKINWFDSKKTFLTLIFIREEDVDDDFCELLEDLLEAMEPDRDKLPDGLIPARPNMADNKGRKKHDCEYYCPKRPKPDTVVTLANIVGTYPCYTAVVAKHVTKDTVSLNIRFRANSILISSESSSDDEDDETE